MPSAGRSFHCLHATSHALQPMHTVVSVKKPIALGAVAPHRDLASGRAVTSPASPLARRRAARWSRPRRRPARTSQRKAFDSWIVMFGSPEIAIRSLAVSPVTPCASARELPQCHGMHTWCTARSPIAQRPHAGRSPSRAPRSRRARVSMTIQPPSSIPRSRRQQRVDLGEHLRLQLGQPRQVAAHRPGGVVLGEPERRGHERVARRRPAARRVLRRAPR